MEKTTQDFLVEGGKNLILPALSAWATHWWHTRTHGNLAGLQVFPTAGAAKLPPEDYGEALTIAPRPAEAQSDSAGTGKPERISAIRFEFKNTTGHVIFIHRCRLTEITPGFYAHNKALFDVGEGAYELKFQPEGSREYNLKEVVLHTGASAKTVIILAKPWDGEIPKTHQRNWLPPFAKKPKLFCISYEAASGTESYSIRTPF